MDFPEEKFDIALIEKECIEGMDLQDMQHLFKKVAADENFTMVELDT